MSAFIFNNVGGNAYMLTLITLLGNLYMSTFALHACKLCYYHQGWTVSLYRMQYTFDFCFSGFPSTRFPW